MTKIPFTAKTSKSEADKPVVRNHDVWTVSTLVGHISSILQRRLSMLSIEGEVTNLGRSARGTQFFNLKDNNAQIKCYIVPDDEDSDFELINGMQIIARAAFKTYNRGGEYSLQIIYWRPKGMGDFQLAFEKLKKKLAHLFVPEHKQPLPNNPQRIGVITSLHGAVIHDIKQSFQSHNPLVKIFVMPTAVQGDDAPEDISHAIRLLEQHSEQLELDLIIIARGGGSREDLWAYNTEVVAQAIFDAHTPIVTSIGHTMDETIADLVADHSCITPTATKECLLDYRELVAVYNHLDLRLNKSLNSYLEQQQFQLQTLTENLHDSLKKLVHNGHTKVDDLTTRLNILDPRRALQRGYALAYNAQNACINSVEQLQYGDKLLIRLRDGIVEALVEKVQADTMPSE